MEWQNEQVRFFSNSGVFGVSNNGNYQGGVLMTAILTAVTLFAVGVLVGGMMVENRLKRKLGKGGFMVFGNEIYLCKKVMLVDASEVDDE